MPWKSEMDQRLEFVRLAMCGGVSISSLCRRFGISRDTGHRLLRLHAEQGAAGLEPCSRRPRHSPRKVCNEVEQAVLSARTLHPAWGGRKIARWLADQGLADVPSPSTVTEVLRRHGRLGAAADAPRLWQRFERAVPNELWQMDYKGHFAMSSGTRCHALTVLDDHSRYNLGLRACADERDVTVRGHLTSLFRRYGLPEAMLADNGPPWGCAGADASRGGMTALGVWLMQLGIDLLHGRPRHPQTQGKEERFHRTLDVEVLQHARFADLAACQVRFDAWREIYNDQRPHEALGLATPSTRYRASERSFPEQLAAPAYYSDDLVRRVSADGYVIFKGRKAKMSQAYAGHQVALRPSQQDGVWTIYFSRFAVAQVDLRHSKTISQQCVRDVSEHLSGLSPV